MLLKRDCPYDSEMKVPVINSFLTFALLSGTAPNCLSLATIRTDHQLPAERLATARLGRRRRLSITCRCRTVCSLSAYRRTPTRFSSPAKQVEKRGRHKKKCQRRIAARSLSLWPIHCLPSQTLRTKFGSELASCFLFGLIIGERSFSFLLFKQEFSALFCV